MGRNQVFDGGGAPQYRKKYQDPKKVKGEALNQKGWQNFFELLLQKIKLKINKRK